MNRIWNALVAAAYNAVNNSFLAPLFALVDVLFQYAFGGGRVLFADVVVTDALGYTYANGSSGVGATLTAGSNGVFPTKNGVTPFLGMLVLVTAEAAPARNGYFRLTRLGDSSTTAQLTRDPTWDASAEMLAGTAAYVRRGTYAGTIWSYTGPALPTVGTTALTFAQDKLLRSAVSGVGGNSWNPVRAGSLANVNIASAPATLDGVNLVAGDRVLLKNQTDPKENGIRIFTAAAAALARSADANNSAQWTDGKTVEVLEGTQHETVWFFDAPALPFTLDVDNAPFDRETGVMHVANDQTVTGIKRFAQLALGLWNAAKTFSARFTFNGAGDRTVTVPDVDFTMAQAGVATGAGGTANTSSVAPTVADPTHNHIQNAHTHTMADPQHNHGGATGASGTDATGSTAPGFTDGGHDHGGATGASGTGAVTGSTDNATATNAAETRSGHTFATAPIVADTTTYVALVGIANGAQVIAAQPDHPRKVQIRVTDGDVSITAGTITIVGVGARGQALNQAFDIANQGTATYTTADAYATITSITVAGLVGEGVLDTIEAGPTNALGLVATRVPVPSAFSVYKANVDGANEAIGVVDGAAGTIIPTTAPNGARNFAFFFNYAATPTQNAHLHVAGTLAGPSHTHTIASGTTGATVDAHTHTGPSHTHTIASGVTGVTADNETATNQAAATGLTVDAHVHAGPSHTHMQS